MVAALDAGLSLHRCEQLGLGEVLVVGHGRPAAIEAGIVAHHVVCDDRTHLVALLFDAHVRRVCARPSAPLLAMAHEGRGRDLRPHPA
jgi:hypothetical protein